METTLLALAMLALAIALAAIGVTGRAERLPRNRWVGLRTQRVRDDDESWRIGHRAVGGALIAAAGPPLLLAVALVATPPDEIADWLLVYGLVGIVTGGLIALAARSADRAMEEHEPTD